MRALVALLLLSSGALHAQDDERRTLSLPDGSELEYALVLPPEHDPERATPLLLALPPGDGSWAMVEAGLDRYWRDEARRRGWIVASPAAGAGVAQPLLDALRHDHRLEGRPHLAGVSNGGRAAFAEASLLPGEFGSLLALPGYAELESDLGGLADVPVHLFVGGDDRPWRAHQAATAARLFALGNGEVTATVLEGEGHSPASLEGGERLFDLLDDARAREAALAACDAVLDALHLAASEADGERYFDLFSRGAVFYGTDAGERWTIQEFREYAAPFFGAGRGWTYLPTERHVFVSPGRDVAWFDERLVNAKYGEVRGSGALARRGDAWLIEQYNLAFPVPNELAAGLLERVRVRELAARLDDGAEVEPAPRLVVPTEGDAEVALYAVAGAEGTGLSLDELAVVARERVSDGARLEVHGGVWRLAGTPADHADLGRLLGLARARRSDPDAAGAGADGLTTEMHDLGPLVAAMVDLSPLRHDDDGGILPRAPEEQAAWERTLAELEALVPAAVLPASWGGEVELEVTAQGVLVVQHYAAGHAAVRALLDELRAALDEPEEEQADAADPDAGRLAARALASLDSDHPRPPAPRLERDLGDGRVHALHPLGGLDPGGLDHVRLLAVARQLLSRDADLVPRGATWELAGSPTEQDALSELLGQVLAAQQRPDDVVSPFHVPEEEPQWLKDLENHWFSSDFTDETIEEAIELLGMIGDVKIELSPGVQALPADDKRINITNQVRSIRQYFDDIADSNENLEWVALDDRVLFRTTVEAWADRTYQLVDVVDVLEHVAGAPKPDLARPVDESAGDHELLIGFSGRRPAKEPKRTPEQVHWLDSVGALDAFVRAGASTGALAGHRPPAATVTPQGFLVFSHSREDRLALEALLVDLRSALRAEGGT